MKTNYTIHGLRGLCALMVFVGHLVGMAMNIKFITISDATWQYFFKLAGTGVNIFFAISGYIIIHSLVKQNQVKVFVKNRLLRIYPVYIVIFCLMAVMGPLTGFEWFKDISTQGYIKELIASLFMLQGHVFGFNEVVPNAWSLNYEFIFYLAACLFFIVITKLKVNNALKWCLFIAVLATSILFVVRYPAALFFVVGVTTYFLEQKIRSVRFPVLVAMFGGIVFFICTWLTKTNIYLSVLLSFPFFISIVREEGVLSKLLRLNFFKYLGSISYSFYLWHAFGIYIAKIMVLKLISTHHGVMPTLIYGIVGTALSVLLSHYSYKYIEVKFTNRLRQKPSRTPAILIKESA